MARRQTRHQLKHGDSSIHWMPESRQIHHFADGRTQTEAIPAGFQAVVYSTQPPRLGWHLLGRFRTEAEARQAVADWRA